MRSAPEALHPLLAGALLLLASAGSSSAEVATLAVLNGSSGTPGGLAVDAEGNVFCADFGGTALYRIDPDGSSSILADGFATPSGTVLDAEGYLLQSNYGDSNNFSAPDAISRVSTAGDVESWVDGVFGPVGLAPAPDGSLFVATCDSQTVTRVEQDRSVETFASSSLFNCPNGIVRDEYGDLFVANWGDGLVLRIGSDGEVSSYASLPSPGLGHITWVSGSLYVADRLGHRIWQIPIKPNGQPRQPFVLTGTGEAERLDGPDGEAKFNRPNGIIRNPSGDTLYTNEAGGAVRTISLDLDRPKKPKKFSGRLEDDGTIRLSWKDKDRNREGWFVEVKIKGETGWEPIADVPAPTDSVDIEGLEAGKRYLFRLVAYNATDLSKPSKKVRANP